MRIELMTSSLPRMRSTTELREHIPLISKNFGAGDEARTRDPQLGRLMLYQLSYSRSTDFGLVDSWFCSVQVITIKSYYSNFI